MAGLAGADQGGPGLGNNPHGRVSRGLEDLPVALSVRAVPAGRTADIKAAVLSLDEASRHVQFSQDSSREALDIPGAGRICQKTAFKAQASFDRVRSVTGLFPDQELSGAQTGIGRNETARLPDGHHLRLGLLIFFQICNSTLGVAEVKSKIPVHGSSFPAVPPCKPLSASLSHRTAVPFFRSFPSCASAGRIVTTDSSPLRPLSAKEAPGREGSISNQAEYCALQGRTSISFLCR